MRSRIFSLIMMLAALVGLIVDATQRALADSPSTQPAAIVSTQPSGFSVQGDVKIAANMDLASVNLTRVVVYLESDPALDAVPPPQDPAICAQRNKQFIPNFLVISKGRNVEFPNWDHFSHNVFSRSAAAPAFDLDRYPYGQSKTRQFDKVGVVQIFCNIHPWMRALIYVAPNPYFTRADARGNFAISGVPAGSYTLTAWQERCGSQHQTIVVGPGVSPGIHFTLQEDRDSILANDPPVHGSAYGVDRGLGVKREKLNLPVVEDSHPAPTTAPSDTTANNN